MSAPMTRSRGRRSTVHAVLLLSLAAAVAACSSSSPSSTAHGTGPAAPASASAIAQVIAEASKPLAFTAPGPAIDVSSLKGKKLAVVVSDLSVPLLASVVTAVKDAASHVGLQVSVFNGQDVVGALIQGLEEAGAEHAGAVALVGEAPNLLTAGLQRLKAEGIPVISVTNNQPNPSQPGQGSGQYIYATVAPDFELGGKLMADYIGAHGPSNSQIGLITSDIVLGSHFIESGFRQELAKVCPACRIVASQDSSPADWGSQVPSQASAMVLAHPSMNYIVAMFDDQGLYATTGAKSAGKSGKVKVLGFNGTAGAPLSLVKNGSVFVADPGSSGLWAGWATVDQAMRGMLGKPPATPYDPIRFLDTANLQGVDVSSDAALYGTSYKAGFLKLWGVS